MLNHCIFEGRSLDLGRTYNFDNKFTVIVGKNGTGKSRLLSAIIKDLINAHYKHDLPLNKPPFQIEDFYSAYENLPVKIIANFNKSVRQVSA